MVEENMTQEFNLKNIDKILLLCLINNVLK